MLMDEEVALRHLLFAHHHHELDVLHGASLGSVVLIRVGAPRPVAACSVLEALQSGDPINMWGFCWPARFVALARLGEAPGHAIIGVHDGEVKGEARHQMPVALSP